MFVQLDACNRFSKFLFAEVVQFIKIFAKFLEFVSSLLLYFLFCLNCHWQFTTSFCHYDCFLNWHRRWRWISCRIISEPNDCNLGLFSLKQNRKWSGFTWFPWAYRLVYLSFLFWIYFSFSSPQFVCVMVLFLPNFASKPRKFRFSKSFSFFLFICTEHCWSMYRTAANEQQEKKRIRGSFFDSRLLHHINFVNCITFALKKRATRSNANGTMNLDDDDPT